MGMAATAKAAAGYLTRRLTPSGAAPGGADPALAEGMDEVRTLVGTVLADDPALAALERQAAAGRVSERTLQRVALAIEDAAEAHRDFADRLDRLVTDLQSRESRDGATASGPRSVVIRGNNTGIVSTGDNATITQHR